MSTKEGQLGLRIDADLEEWLKNVAKDNGVKKSEIVREALIEYRESRDDKLMKKLIEEDGFLYKMVTTNGHISFKRIKKELVNF